MLALMLSVSARAAILTSSVDMDGANTPTVHYFSTPTTQDQGDLHAMGMRWFGVGTRVVSLANGDPSPLGEGYSAMLSNQAVAISPGDTWEMASWRYIDRHGSAGSKKNGSPLNTAYKYESCALASVCEACGTSLARFYPGSCSAIPWTNTSCTIMTDNLLINHDTLTAGQVSGNTASASTEVRCTSTAIVRFRVSESRVYLGNNIYSDIYVNGRGFGGAWGDMNYTVPSWGLPLTVESRLVSLNPLPGAFFGSIVVIVNII